LADEPPNPLQHPLPGGIVPEDEVIRTEKRWLIIMLGMLAAMMAVIVVTGITHALHPPSNVEGVDPVTLHQRCVSTNCRPVSFLPFGSAACIQLRNPAQRGHVAGRQGFVSTPVKFRVTSADVIHGLIIGDTNVNTMVVPRFVSEVRTSFAIPGDYRMVRRPPCLAPAITAPRFTSGWRGLGSTDAILSSWARWMI
jgi:cytochrome c oxidase subunit II